MSDTCCCVVNHPSSQRLKRHTVLWQENQVWLKQNTRVSGSLPLRGRSPVLAGAAASLEGSPREEGPEFTHMIVDRTLLFSGWKEALGSLLAVARNLCQLLQSGPFCWAAPDRSQRDRGRKQVRDQASKRQVKLSLLLHSSL